MLDWLRSRISRRTEQAAPPAAAPPPARTPLELYRTGDSHAAAQAAAALLEQEPTDAAALLVQGLIALDEGRAGPALQVLAPALARDPASADLHVAVGRAHAAAGRGRAAVQAFERALALVPGHPGATLQQALLALAAGRRDQAIRGLEDAIRGDPQLGEAHLQLGNLRREAGRLDLAQQHYRRAVEARPNDAATWSNLGALLKDQGQAAEAASSLERALALRPDLAAASFNLAMLRAGEQRWDDVARLLRSSLAADAKQADGWYWLGNACMGLGDAAGAREAYARALRVDAGFVQARWGLAMAQLPAVAASAAEQAGAAAAFHGELEKLQRWFRTNRPAEGYRAVGAQQPYYLAYIPGDHKPLLDGYGTLCASLMGQWARKVGVPAPVKATGSKRRIGIVSAHLHSHSVWHAIVRGWVEHLDPSEFELHLFHTGQVRDGETEWAARRARLRQGEQDWTAWAKVISDSRLDALISPEIGMDATAVRLGALRLAPVQLASWGHPITTGLPTMDGFVSAEAFEPAGASAHYTERLIALPRLGCCYRPYGTPATAPDLRAGGIEREDRLLLCAGTPFKYAPQDDALLVDIARRCRPCKLVFFRARNEALSDRLAQRLRGAFEAAGLRFDDFVRFVPWQTQSAFFGWLDRADAYLDSPGFSGFNTAMQAVERGTPIVAWEGDFMRGRFASGILRQAGLGDQVAGSREQYAALVERLCLDRAARDDLRGRIAAARPALYGDQAAVTALAACLRSLTDGSTPLA